MLHIEPIEIVQRLIALVFASILTSWTWLIWSVFTGQPILPEEPLVGRRAIPWNVGPILLVFVLYVAVNLLFTVIYYTVAPLAGFQPGVTPSSHMMAVNGSAMLVLLILVPWVVRRTSGARLVDFGLSFHNWWRQAVHGVIAILIAAPPIYAVQFGAEKLWKRSEHPVTKMITHEFSPGVGLLAIVTAVVLAPMLEELVFRGLLQSWLIALFERRSGFFRRPLGKEPDASDSAADVSLAGDRDVVNERRPIVPANAAPESDLFEPPGRHWIAIVVTSLLFGYVHAAQWPAPIALFVLALVIGTVYYRTGSLITAVCMHATFNAITTLALFETVLSGQKSEPHKVTEQPVIERRILLEIDGSPQPAMRRCDRWS